MRQVFLKHVFGSRMWAWDWENTSTWDKNDPCHHEAYCLMTSQRKWRPVLFTDFLFPPWLKCLGFLKYVSKLGHEFQIRDPQYIRGTEWIFEFGILFKDLFDWWEIWYAHLLLSHSHLPIFIIPEGENVGSCFMEGLIFYTVIPLHVFFPMNRTLTMQTRHRNPRERPIYLL